MLLTDYREKLEKNIESGSHQISFNKNLYNNQYTKYSVKLPRDTVEREIA